MDKQGFVMIAQGVCECVWCVCVRVCLLTSIPFFVGSAKQATVDRDRQQVEEAANWFRQIPKERPGPGLPAGAGSARVSE